MYKIKTLRERVPEQFEKLANGKYDDFEVLVHITDGDDVKVTPLRMINFDEKLKTAWFAGNVSKNDSEYFKELYEMHEELRKKQQWKE